MFSNPRRIAVLCFLFVLSVLAGAMLIPVTAAPQTQQQAYFVPDSQNGDTAIIQVAYEPPPAALQVTDEPAPTDEASPVVEVTAEPGSGGDVTIINNPPAKEPDNTPLNLTQIVYGVVIAFIAGGTVAGVLSRLQQNKAVIDAAEGIYEDKVSPEAQQTIRVAFEHIRDLSNRAFDILDKITDGKPNEINPETAEALRSISQTARDIHNQQPPAQPPRPPQ